MFLKGRRCQIKSLRCRYNVEVLPNIYGERFPKRHRVSKYSSLSSWFQLIYFVFTSKSAGFLFFLERPVLPPPKKKKNVFKDVHPFQFASQKHFHRRGNLVPRKQNIWLALLLAGEAKRPAARQTLRLSLLKAKGALWVKRHPFSLELPVLNLVGHSSPTIYD